MQVTTEIAPVSRKMLWAGRIISGLVALFFLFGAVNGLMKTAQVVQGMAQFGFPEHLARVIGVLELVCAIVYLIPRTSILGAILLTGYLGGATATHMRMSDPKFVVPIFFGVLVWLGLWLRDTRLRTLIPLHT